MSEMGRGESGKEGNEGWEMTCADGQTRFPLLQKLAGMANRWLAGRDSERVATACNYRQRAGSAHSERDEMQKTSSFGGQGRPKWNPGSWFAAMAEYRVGNEAAWERRVPRGGRSQRARGRPCFRSIAARALELYSVRTRSAEGTVIADVQTARGAGCRGDVRPGNTL